MLCGEAAASPCHGNGEPVFYPDSVKIEFSFLCPDDGEELMELGVCLVLQHSGFLTLQWGILNELSSFNYAKTCKTTTHLPAEKH